DIYRHFPLLRYLMVILPNKWVERFMCWFSRHLIPVTLSKIQVIVEGRTHRGYLLSTSRTPSILRRIAPRETPRNLDDLFLLAARKGVQRVGLGALLPSMTRNGQRFEHVFDRPAVSTGHAYTAYVIVEFLTYIAARRHPGRQTVTVGIVGAAGSTGKATLRVLKRLWTGPQRIELLLIDLPKKTMILGKLAHEVRASGVFANVRVATDLSALADVQYALIVTNAAGAIIRPEHVRPETVIIDDSQPRNTSPALVEHGCHVVDVLARVPGLDCRFDFGFHTPDKTVTFTCLAETVLATIAGDFKDLAVGEVTEEVVEHMLKIVGDARLRGIIGPPPFLSFGIEMSREARDALFTPPLVVTLPVVAAE
ncbi:MAG: hypothetical protein KGH79_04815, partial [Patescibacteria group bacterium]|nr:hypothetical protein [Patescibacteria group bacterium]